MTGARLVARTVRGIEAVLADEIESTGVGIAEQQGHREVRFRHTGSAVLDLRCADDVFLIGASVPGVDHTKASLQLLSTAAASVPVHDLQALREKLGGPRQPLSVDVSASFLGRRNYNRYDLEDAVGVPLAATAGLPYYARRAGRTPPPGAMSWRLTVADNEALLALRISSNPLHRRTYRQATRPGSIHPPLAATSSVDLVVTNPPWDRQVAPTGVLGRHPIRFWHELRRVLKPDGRALVLLTQAEDRLAAVEQVGLTLDSRQTISLSGSHPEIVVLS